MVLKRLDMVATLYHTGSVADRKVSWGRLEGAPRICDGFSGFGMRFRWATRCFDHMAVHRPSKSVDLWLRARLSGHFHGLKHMDR